MFWLSGGIFTRVDIMQDMRKFCASNFRFCCPAFNNELHLPTTSFLPPPPKRPPDLPRTPYSYPELYPNALLRYPGHYLHCHRWHYLKYRHSVTGSHTKFMRSRSFVCARHRIAVNEALNRWQQGCEPLVYTFQFIATGGVFRSKLVATILVHSTAASLFESECGHDEFPCGTASAS